MKLVSWNVNGIRAAMDKGFREYVEAEQPDLLCLQETKAMEDQVDLAWARALGYSMIWNPAEKKGYSGTAILARETPAAFQFGMGAVHHDQEGRVITADCGDFQLLTVYTPNSQRGLTRLPYRQEWDRDFLAFLKKLKRKKPVIFCGDLNCAHEEIDLANPKSNRKNAGFTDEEREGLTRIFEDGFLDSFRQFEEGPGHYSWWTYRSNARERNIGWRLDYFGLDERIREMAGGARILTDVYGSDHCPVELTLK